MCVFITFHTELNSVFQMLQLRVTLILWKSSCYKWAVVQMKWRWLFLPLSASVWCCARPVSDWISLSDHILTVEGWILKHTFPPSAFNISEISSSSLVPRWQSHCSFCCWHVCVLNLVEWVWVSQKWTQTPRKSCIIVLSCIHVLMEQHLWSSTDVGWFQVDK